MKQRTLAMMTGFEKYTKKSSERYFWRRWSRVAPWRKLCALVEPRCFTVRLAEIRVTRVGRRPEGVLQDAISLIEQTWVEVR
jgi:hypothetical protein